MMFPTRLTATIAIASAFTCVSVQTQAGTMQADSYDFLHRRIAETTPEARSVGHFELGYDGGGLVRGSGVLVGSRYVLTSAHLLDDAGGGFFYINGQSYATNRWVVANRFYARDTDGPPNPETRIYGNGADLALVELARPVVGARNLKATINRSRKEAGKTATIVGWGTAGNGADGIYTTIPDTDGSLSNGDGAVWNYVPVQRAGYNIIEPRPPQPGANPFIDRELTVDFDVDPSQYETLRAAGLNPPTFNPFTGEYDIDENDIPLAQEYMPAVGDSGGGLFINGKLAGITSWSTRADSQFFSQAQFTRLSIGWWKWVRDNIRAFNHARLNGTTARPWNRVNNQGNGFRGVAKILSESQLEDDGGNVIFWEGQVINIFGPGLFFDETNAEIEVGQNIGEGNPFTFFPNDIFGGAGDGLTAGPLRNIQYPSGSIVPEPTTLALLGLGGLAVLGRRRA